MFLEALGKVLCIDDTDTSNRLSKRLGIKSTHAQLIFVSIMVTVNNVTYTIRVRELCSWTPTFLGSGFDCDDSDEEEHVDIDNVHIQSHSSTPEENNGKPNDYDPFELEHLINKSGKSHKPCHSVTPDYSLGFSSVLKGDQVTSDSIQKLSDGDHIQQPGFSILERLEETIKIGSALGLNMEGLGDLNKRRWIRDLCHANNVNFLAIQESKMLHVDLWMLRQIWGNVHFDFASTSARAVMGDFNNVRNEGERFGSVFCNRQARIFNEFIANNSLIYIPLGGYNFTWTNKWGTKMSKLDRFLVSENFLESFPHATGLVMEKGIPDHRPIFLKESTVDYGPTSFLFFHSWLELDGSDNYALKKEHENKLSAIDKKVDLESKDYAQKAKIKWALEGDENTKFFHGTLKKKRRQLAIRGILKDDLSSPMLLPPSIDLLSFTTISQTQRDYLDIPFLRDKFKRVVWDFGGERASRPDDFTFCFFTTFWNTIEKDVVRFVQEFFQSHVIPKGCNPSFIALIPKVPYEKFVSDFCPISLIGCQYTIIGKLLANRLSNVIKDCITHVQSAFIKGRFILDGPFILNEVLAEYRHHHKELLIFKVDIEKAFDSLRWDFLDAAMDKMGFGSKWRSWIMGCLKHARSSILVRKAFSSISILMTKEFERFRGLRQGDPLSPLLFILAMEGLHSLTRKVKELNLFKGASIGLKINIDKSSVLGVGVSDVDVYHMANIIGCGVSKFPFKYLGVLVGFGGRLSLIKAVLGNLPTYFMSLYMMPTLICSKLESLRNKCFRGAGHNESKMSWVKWEKSLASINKGWLCIGSIFGLNIGLSFKWIWRLRNRPTDLWAQVIGIIYGHDGGITRSSSRWRKHSNWGIIVSSINRLKDKGVDLLSLCTRKLGNGVSISFWEDTWIWTSPFRSQFPRIYMLDTNKSCCIANRASLTSADWFSRILRRTPRVGAELSQFEALTALIGSVHLIDSCDSWQWRPNYTVGYTVASARALIDESILETDHVATRWNRNIPIKVNIFLWRLNLNKLPTRVNLERKGFVIGSSLCPLCHLDVKTANHLFFNCELARDLWSSLAM
nr:hypothetical protein [Tanacetum cinerariifolium]